MAIRFTPKSVLLILLLCFVAILAVLYILQATNPYLSLSSILSVQGIPGSCRILEERYCETGKLVNYKGRDIGIGFDLPKGVPVFSPLSGEANYTLTTFLNEKINKGVTIGYLPNDKIDSSTINFTAAHNSEYSQKIANVQIGDILFKTTGQNINGIDGYNLIISFQKYDTNKKYYVFDMETTKEYFTTYQL